MVKTKSGNTRTKKVIHVHQANIKHNSKCDQKDMKAPIIVRTSEKSHHFNEIRILGESRIIYRPQDPISCGARLWIETNAEVIGK